MRLYYFLILITILCISACKEDKGNSTDPEAYRPAYEVMQVLSAIENNMNAYSVQGASTSLALAKAAADAESLPTVSNTLLIDSNYVHITMTSGREAVYFLSPVDASGNPLLRGGGSGGGGVLRQVTANCTNEITNKKILVLNAEFNTLGSARRILEDNALKFGLEVTFKHGEECTYDMVKTMGDYGLVVINTHGFANGFMLGTTLPVGIKDSLLTLEDFATAIGGDPQRNQIDQALIDIELMIAATKHFDPSKPIHYSAYSNADKSSIAVSSTLIAQLNLSGTVVLGNMCYSGFDNTALLAPNSIPIVEGFRQAGTRTYYGYQQTASLSIQVTDRFAQLMEERLYGGFFEDEDSTGNVHLDMNGLEYSDSIILGLARYAQYTVNAGLNKCRRFFADNYCYEGGCDLGQFTDSRDGRKYLTIQIGNQIWMAENLNWAGVGVCYDNDPVNCATYGRLYTWEEVMDGAATSNANPSGVQGICPNGWHVPSHAEWMELEMSLGVQASEYDNDSTTLNNFGATYTLNENGDLSERLRSDSLWAPIRSQNDDPNAINATCFNALPAGIGNNNTMLGASANFWTSTQNGTVFGNMPCAFARVLVGISSNAQTRWDVSVKERGNLYGFSCRCVKD